MPFSLTGIASTISKLIWQTDTDWNKGTVPGTMEVSGTGNSAVLTLMEKSDSNSNIPYTTPGNYTLSDGVKVEVASDEARLYSPSGVNQTWPFTTAGNYTYDATKIEVTGGEAALKRVIPDADIELWCHLNASSGSAVTDSSSNSTDGTTSNMDDSNWVAGHLNNALTFDGVNESVGFGNILSFERTDPFSLECWYKGTYAGGFGSLICKQDLGAAPRTGYSMALTNSGADITFLLINTVVGAGNRIQISTTTASMNDDAWHQVIVTYDGSSSASGCNIWIDGIDTAFNTIYDNLSATIVTTNQLEFGMRNNNNYLSGTLDECAVYSVALTSDQVAFRYNAGTGTEGYYWADNPTIVNNTGLAFTTNLNSFTETSTIPASTGIQYQMSADDGTTYEWYNGAAWVARTTTDIPSAIATTVGTLDAGNLASVQTLDGSTYDVSEIAASPGLTITIDYSGVIGPPTTVTIHGYYTGNHAVDVDIWDYDTTSWVTLGQLATGGGSIVQQDFTVTGTIADKISGGAIQTRLNHAAMGNASHDLFIDQAIITIAPATSWYYTNESNTAAEVNTNIGTLAASGTVKFNTFFETNSTGTDTASLDSVYISEPLTCSTDDDLYVETKNTSQVSVSELFEWLTATVSSTTPTNTDVKLLFSNDSRSSWLTWSGSAWVAPTSATTRTDATSITDAQTNFSSLPIGSKLLDVRLFLYTSDSTTRPSVANINVTGDLGFETSGTYTTNIVNSTILSLDWDTVSFVQTVPGSTTLTIKARASNDSGIMGSYGSTLTNQTDVGVSGQYIQFEIVMTGLVSVRPNINSLAVTYDIPITQEINP